MREQGRCVTGNMVKQQALQLSGNVEFRASNGWLQNFLKRKHLVRRRITTSGRDLPRNAGQLVRDLLESSSKYRTPDFSRQSLVNMDETSIYLDDSSLYLKFTILFVAHPN